MFGQWLTCWFRSGARSSRRLNSTWTGGFTGLRGLGRLQLFQLQLQLFDLSIQLLRLAAELHAPQLGDQQLQLLDLAAMREQLLMLRKDQRL